jgi:hypothetical protein
VSAERETRERDESAWGEGDEREGRERMGRGRRERGTRAHRERGTRAHGERETRAHGVRGHERSSARAAASVLRRERGDSRGDEGASSHAFFRRGGPSPSRPCRPSHPSHPSRPSRPSRAGGIDSLFELASNPLPAPAPEDYLPDPPDDPPALSDAAAAAAVHAAAGDSEWEAAAGVERAAGWGDPALVAQVRDSPVGHYPLP